MGGPITIRSMRQTTTDESAIEIIVTASQMVAADPTTKQAEALQGSQLGDASVAFIIRDTEGILETLDGAIDAGQ